MKNIRVVFMGTPDFAVPVLEKLIEHTNVVLVVSQPDRMVGRKHEIKPTPIKEMAIKHNIPVFQPEKIKENYEQVRSAKPDLLITCAYGQIIPEEVLQLPRIGAFNVHASLLPKYRGGAPIHHCLINGDEKTGVTIMYMEKKMDAGDIVSQVEYQITKEDNVGTLHEILSQMGAKLLIETLPSIIEGTNLRTKQDEGKVTFAYNIKREEEHLDLKDKRKNIINKIRGLNPWPMANILVNDEEYKILEAYFEEKNNVIPSTVRELRKDAIGIDVLDGTIYLTKIKPFGKRIMSVKDYLNGVKKEDILKWQIR